MDDVEISAAKPQFDQDHEELVLDQTWWWAVQISLSVVALLGNLLFLITVIYNRKHRDLQTFVTAIIIAISVLDIVDVLRVFPVLNETLFLEAIFRHIFCSFGVFHELAVAVFLVVLGVAVCVQAGKEIKFYQNKSSWIHKLIIPIIVLLAAAAASPFFLLPYEKLSHTCTDPFRVLNVTNVHPEEFTLDLYSTLVMVFTYVLPLLVIPFAVPIASLKTCIARQCCVPRFKQPIGELIMVTVISIVYLATVICVVLPTIDDMLKLEAVNMGRAPLLWELGNDAVRPVIYFMTNPAVWDGLLMMCCKKSHQLVNEEDEEIEVPLSPVTTV